MTEEKDWTPDGPNCRQCGRHDYALQLGFVADGLGPFMCLCKTAGCPLGPKARPGELTWSTTPPTEPGAYWWSCDGHTPTVVEADHDRDESDRARAERSGAPLFQYEPGLERAVRVTKKLGQWLGPIPRPEAP